MEYILALPLIPDLLQNGKSFVMDPQIGVIIEGAVTVVEPWSVLRLRNRVCLEKYLIMH